MSTSDTTQPGDDPQDVQRLAEENERLRQELESLQGPVAARRRAGWRRVRGVVAGVLVVLTSVCILATALGVWAQRTLSSTDRYVALVAPLAEDPAVTGALSVRLTDEVFVALDVQDRVERALAQIPQLPRSGGLLAGPITAGARNLIEREVDDLLASPEFAELWTDLNRTVHTKLVALLNGDYDELPNVAVNGGEVQLNLIPAVTEVLRRLVERGVNALGIDVTIPSIPAGLDVSEAAQRLGSALGVDLPDDFGRITIMTADQLTGYQDTVRTVKRLLVLLVVVSLLLLAATILVAPDRRRIVMWLAAGLIVTTFLVGVFLRRVEARVMDQISGPGARAAAEDVFAEVSGSLRGVGVVLIVIAAVAGIVAHLLGRPRWFIAAVAWVRRATASRPEGSELEVWVAEHGDLVRIGAVAVAAVVLFITGIDWLPVAVVGGLLALLWWGVSVAERRVSPEVTVPQS